MKLFQIRPKNLSEFQGKESLKANLKTYLKSAIEKNEILDHCLFYGPAGVGKTSLAYIVANEMKQKIKIIQGPEIQEKSDILNILYSLNEKNILFIDEVHAINPKCFEMLYSAMEDFKFNIEIGKEFNKKITTVNLPKFTLIGATTKIGNLPQPFEERFGIVFNIQEYNEQEIEKILNYSIKKMDLKIDIDNSAIKIIASRSKGIPRVAKRLLSRFLDYNYLAKKELDIEKTLNQIGVFDNGLDEIDVLYLKILANNKKMGLKSLSQFLNVDEKTIVNKIEPHLIKNMYINKTISGRTITDKGVAFLNKVKI